MKKSPLALLFVAAVAFPAAAQICPTPGWQEGLGQYLKPAAPLPVNDTKVLPTPDCNFHEWSWEAFVWATALDSNGVPRFLSMPTPESLSATANPAPHKLRLAARSLLPHGAPGFSEGASAFVEADGNVLISPNGYPVYASVHMNPSYFATAKQNLIYNGGYQKQPADAYFAVGAAVFKATWMRLGPGEAAPKGAYTTDAEVPELSVLRTEKSYTVVPSGKFITAKVALVGLHVVGYTVNHPEFLWATFEHNLNTPTTPDNTFTTTGSSPNGYTFYAAKTSYAQVNQPNPPGQGQSYIPPQLNFNRTTQKFSPVSNAVQENRTGGENQTGGPANIDGVNAQGQKFEAGQSAAQAAFASYHLVGTVWMLPNSYVLPGALTLNQTNAVGSVTLANTTAETYVQTAKNTPLTNVLNCFLCHNATSYNFQTPPPEKLASRRIAISHVLSYGTDYAVPNLLNVPVAISNTPRRR
jgi:hypothetical protein